MGAQRSTALSSDEEPPKSPELPIILPVLGPARCHWLEGVVATALRMAAAYSEFSEKCMADLRFLGMGCVALIASSTVAMQALQYEAAYS